MKEQTEHTCGSEKNKMKNIKTRNENLSQSNKAMCIVFCTFNRTINNKSLFIRSEKEKK